MDTRKASIDFKKASAVFQATGAADSEGLSDSAMKAVQTIATTDELLVLGDVALTCAGRAMIRNIGTTTVQLGSDGATYPIQLRAGEFLLTRFNTKEIHAISLVDPGILEFTITGDDRIISGIPLAPDNVNPLAIDDSSIQIAWTDNSNNESGFEVWRSDDGGSTYSLIDTTAADATDYTDTSLTPNTTYFYKVRAVNAAGESDFSDAVSYITCVTGPLYLSFKIKFASVPYTEGGSLVWVLDSNSGNAVTFLWNNTLGSWVYSVNGSADLYADSPVANTYITVDLEMDYSTPGSLTLTPRIDGVAGTPVTNTMISGPRNLLIGMVNNAGINNDHTIDDVTLGNSGFGSTDFLNADFSSTISPPFDAVVDQEGGPNIAIVSGAMHVFPDAGYQAYAQYAIPPA